MSHTAKAALHEAERFEQMAARESDPRLREQCLNVARRYRELAELNAPSDPPSVAVNALSAALAYVEAFCRKAGAMRVDFEEDGQVTVWNAANMGKRGESFEEALRMFYNAGWGAPQ